MLPKAKPKNPSTLNPGGCSYEEVVEQGVDVEWREQDVRLDELLHVRVTQPNRGNRGRFCGSPHLEALWIWDLGPTVERIDCRGGGSITMYNSSKLRM